MSTNSCETVSILTTPTERGFMNSQQLVPYCKYRTFFQKNETMIHQNIKITLRIHCYDVVCEVLGKV